MFGIIISVIVLITMGYLILKNYKPQVVLDDAGNRMFVCSDTDYCRQQSEAKNQ